MKSRFVPKTHCLIITALCLLISLAGFMLMGCAGGAVRPDCSDDSIVAATIYHLRTGNKTYIQKSADGTHAQAYAIINGKHVPLRVFPAFAWYVLPSVEDDMGGGKGLTYTLDEFIRGHNFNRKQIAP